MLNWRYVLGGLVGIVALFSAAVTISIVSDQSWYSTHAPRLNSDLGFQHGSAYVSINGESGREVLSLESITPGGRFQLAGVQSGDIPLDQWRITGFYRMLENARGRDIEFRVVPGGSGPPFERRTTRLIRVRVPQ